MVATDMALWHQRLGHNNKADIQALQMQAHGIRVTKESKSMTCESCATQKARKVPIPNKWGTRANHKMEVVHTDILGPVEDTTLGYRYAIGFVDSHSRYGTVYIMKTRDEVVEKMKMYVADIGRPRTLVSDGALEYRSAAFESYLRDCGIRHEFSAPYTPQENGKIERIWGTVVGMSRCMLDNAMMGKKYWPYALRTAFYVKNRCLHAAINMTPFESFFGEKPDISHLRVFGCSAYMLSEHGKKLDAKATKGIMLGYSDHSKTYLIGYPSDQTDVIRTYNSRNVTFDEATPFFKPLKEKTEGSETTIIQVGSTNDSGGMSDDPDNNEQTEPQMQTTSGRRQFFTERHLMEQIQRDRTNEENRTVQDISGGENSSEGSNLTQPVTVTGESGGEREVRTEETAEGLNISDRPLRHRKPPEYFGNPITGTDVDQIALLSFGHVSETMPTTREALQQTHWKKAMDNEFNSLIEQGVWELVERPPDRKVIGGKWHFTTKLNKDGSVAKFKARFVARGFTQIFGQDYTETYSPTTSLSTIRTFLSVAASKGTKLYQMDIKTAYLNAILDEEVYMEQPEGYEVPGDVVCKLKKSLYGLKQSGRNWHRCLSEHLEDLGFTKSTHDNCLYIRKQGNVLHYAAVWVDDLIYFSDDQKFAETFKKEMSGRFTVGECSELNWFLGMNFEFKEDKIEVSQQAYIRELLRKFGLEDCKGVGSPLPEKWDHDNDSTREPLNLSECDYRGLVGSINYLASTTRPDLSYAAHVLCRHLNNPSNIHWKAGKHVLRYLKTTMEYKLTFMGRVQNIIGYCDADFAGDIDTRKSTAGYCFFMGDGGSVSWSSKLQKSVATSTLEAEVYAASEALKELIYLQGIMYDMGIGIDRSIMMCDSQAAMAMTRNMSTKGKSKHFSTRVAFLRDETANGRCNWLYVSTDNNCADILTKGLGKLKCIRFATTLLRGERGCQDSCNPDCVINHVGRGT